MKNQPSTLPTMYSAEETAKILHCSVGALANDRSNARRIPFHKVMGRILYSSDDLKLVIQQGRIGGHNSDQEAAE